MDSVRYIENKIINHPPCNHCFQTLRHGKTLKEIWNSGKVMLNFIENAEDGLLGLTRGNITSPNGADIGISAEGLKRGKMYVIATIIHELAHVGGAPGNTTPANNEAESVLKCCLLSPYFDPNIFGSINKVSQGSSKKAVA